MIYILSLLQVSILTLCFFFDLINHFIWLRFLSLFEFTVYSWIAYGLVNSDVLPFVGSLVMFAMLISHLFWSMTLLSST